MRYPLRAESIKAARSLAAGVQGMGRGCRAQGHLDCGCYESREYYSSDSRSFAVPTRRGACLVYSGHSRLALRCIWRPKEFTL